jgi:hypothetical protein
LVSNAGSSELGSAAASTAITVSRGFIAGAGSAVAKAAKRKSGASIVVPFS